MIKSGRTAAVRTNLADNTLMVVQSPLSYLKTPTGQSLCNQAAELGIRQDKAALRVANMLCDGGMLDSNDLLILGADVQAANLFFDAGRTHDGIEALLAGCYKLKLNLSDANFSFLSQHLHFHRDMDYLNIDRSIQQAIFRFLRIDPFEGEGLELRELFWSAYGSPSVVHDGYPFLAGAHHIRNASLSAMQSINKCHGRAISLTNDVCSLMMDEYMSLADALEEALHEINPFKHDYSFEDKRRAKAAFWKALDVKVDIYGAPILRLSVALTEDTM